MSGDPSAARTAAQLREQLEAITGIQRAVVEGPPWTAYLICGADAVQYPVESAAAVAVARAGLEPDAVTLRTSFLGPPTSRRRVRLIDARLTHPAVRSAAATVSLEWSGTEYAGEADGEGGPGGELRVCALATLRALQAVVPEMPPIQLVGTRSLRVFDRDLLVVLVRAGEPVERSLLGASLVADDLPLSVARAVLNALNRLLGNYLSVGD